MLSGMTRAFGRSFAASAYLCLKLTAVDKLTFSFWRFAGVLRQIG
jgi:hypothetical protein